MGEKVCDRMNVIDDMRGRSCFPLKHGYQPIPQNPLNMLSHIYSIDNHVKGMGYNPTVDSSWRFSILRWNLDGITKTTTTYKPLQNQLLCEYECKATNKPTKTKEQICIELRDGSITPNFNSYEVAKAPSTKTELNPLKMLGSSSP